ncbi:MAG: thymidylate synthase [Mariprofundaceae bacterium]|nr:thymidylate synthase [Mariprofundaceae bacterium]
MRTLTLSLIIATFTFSSLAWADDAKPTKAITATDKIVARFIALDTNKTEGVSYKEYMVMVQTRAKTRFSLMDSNHDNEVTADEYRHFWRTQKSQYYRLKR